MYVLFGVVVLYIHTIVRGSGTIKCGHTGGNVKVTMWTRYSQGCRLFVVYV